MKSNHYYLIILLLLIQCQISNAQYESVFGENYTEWNYTSLLCDALINTRYLTTGDTVISDELYQIINVSNDELGYLRESENSDKLWFLEKGSISEKLIFDLEVDLLDTFWVNSLPLIVDSIYFDDNRKIILFDYHPPSCANPINLIKFMEGLGPTEGFNFMVSGYDWLTNSIRCHTKDTITTHYLVDLFGDDCTTSIVSVNDESKVNIQIGPNPFFDQIRIDFGETQKRKVYLLNSLGQIQFKISSKNQIENISTRNLKRGVYFLIVENEDERETFKLFKMER